MLFFAYAMFAAVDWLYSLIPVRFPDIKICMSEGGIGWVAGLLDRLDHMLTYHEMYGTWIGIELTPAEVLQRNFWFCAVEDPSSFSQRERIGVDHILLESDYPHCDSTWPHTQRTIEEELVRAAAGGRPQVHLGERLGPLPPPGPPRGPAGPQRLLRPRPVGRSLGWAT